MFPPNSGISYFEVKPNRLHHIGLIILYMLADKPLAICVLCFVCLPRLISNNPLDFMRPLRKGILLLLKIVVPLVDASDATT